MSKDISNSKSPKLFKVQLGAYRDRKNADKLLSELEDKGFNGFIRFPKDDDLFRVQTGAYTIRGNADKLLKRLYDKGFKGFIVVEEKEKNPIKADKRSRALTVGNAKIIKTTPDNIYIPVLGSNLFKGGFYGVNGTFFDTATAPVSSPNSCVFIAVNGGKSISNNASINGYPGKVARGTIHYNGKRLGNRKVKRISELPKDTDWAIGGFTIKPYMDFKREQIPASINYKTAHTYLGYDAKGYVYLIVKPSHNVHEIVPTLNELGITQCILLDGGGSSQLNYRGIRHYSSRNINTALLLKRE